MKIGLLTSRYTDTFAFISDLNKIYPNAEIININADDWTEDNVNKFLIDNDLAMLFIDDKLARTLDYERITRNSTTVIMNESFAESRKGAQVNE